MTYFNYGLGVVNIIGFEILGWQRMPGNLVFREWPGNPPLPHELDYESGS